MKYKMDWDETVDRYCALWNGRSQGGPYIQVTAPNGRAVEGPAEPAHREDRFLDPKWVTQNVRASLESRWWGGMAIPSSILMGGWVVSLGGRPNFSRQTIWFNTFSVDFDEPSPFVVAGSDPWVRKHEAVYLGVAELAGYDDFLLGQPLLLPANDLLSMHLGTTSFLTALVDEPGWMKRAILQGGESLLKERMRLRDLVQPKHKYWYGNAGWMPFWAPEPFFQSQSDVSCMLSPEMFEEFVVPELNLYGESFGAMWYHLDGADAKQHLPRLVSLPYIRVVQYVPTPAEPPNGPDHIALYRTIQAAGKIVHIGVHTRDVEPLVRGLDPARLLLEVACSSIAEGEALLSASRKWG